MSAPAGRGTRAISSVTSASIVAAPPRRARAARWWPSITKYVSPSLTATIGGKPPSANAASSDRSRSRLNACSGRKSRVNEVARLSVPTSASSGIARTPRYRRPNGLSRRSSSSSSSRRSPRRAPSSLAGGGRRAARQHPIRPREVTCVSVRIPLEVILMLGLGLPERPRRRHLRHDLSGPTARGFDVRDRLLRDVALVLVEVEDRRPIARPHVVSLTVQRRWVMNLEEELEQVTVGRLLGIEADLDRLRVRAVVAIGGIRDVAARVPDPCRQDAAALPDEGLHPPEAASREDRLLGRSVHQPPPEGEKDSAATVPSARGLPKPVTPSLSTRPRHDEHDHGGATEWLNGNLQRRARASPPTAPPRSTRSPGD